VLVLALDTTTRAGSVALVDDKHVRLERVGNPTLTHGQRLPGDLSRVVEEAGASLADIDLLAVAAGPGSFTGLRVGIAAIQGLAMALDLRVVGVSSLEALARTAGPGEGPVAVWMDAQRGQVFAALYDETGRTVLIDASALPPDHTLARWEPRLPAGSVRFVGDGAVRYAPLIQASRPGHAQIAAPTPPIAGIIGGIAIAEAGRAVPPHAVVPIYVRRSDAELARLRRGTRA
jgi:tRNA threonylcarbamoyladenosine biosynthesis protein TsaB